MNEIKGRVINVSNRLPILIKKYAGGARLERSSGGLATALEAGWRDQPGVWIGWAGTGPEESIEPMLVRAAHHRSYTLRSVALTEEDIAKFYSGFANEIIWPLFHDMPSRCNFDPEYWATYEQVNRKFARVVAETAQDDDFIWIHDYHLMLTAAALRQKGVRARMGFFLHIPFPSPDVFEKLPWKQPILRALLEFDVIGFQGDRDRSNFVSCLERLLPEATVERGSLHLRVGLEGRHSVVGTFPIGIDFEAFERDAQRPETAAHAAELRKRVSDEVLVLGVDRLDYTKGIPERLKSFRLLLRRFPEMRGHITLVQVVVPSREEIPNYKHLRREVELLVSQINGEFTEPGWVPVHYIHRNLGRDELLAYYRAADIGLVTPLKDGMNLVAKEFCAAQIDERGVLIVSEFAGAGPELRSAALIVNPNDFAEVAQALYDAAHMSVEEKRSRMRLLRQIVKDHNVHRWIRSFLQAIPSLDHAKGGGGGDSWSQPAGSQAGPQIGLPVRLDQKMPGVALVATSLSPRNRSRYAMGRDAKLRVLGTAAGED
ncbi:MAG TPA: trehalose-6-phosphate synthase [Terriglobales bacterium]|jgi:alpha,alpha-trehalose-phosphate synthase [UDP-forming]|nr:trehalose-6-phosphate synthase [Terriglobales bacterium]